MDGDARLPEVFSIKASGGPLIVRSFPAARAMEFPHLSQAERRAIPAIVRRLFKTSARYAGEDADCLICEAPAPLEGRILVALEKDGGHELGVVCEDCARLGALDARAQS